MFSWLTGAKKSASGSALVVAAGQKKPMSCAYLALARFNLAWLTDGQDTATPSGGN